MMDEARLDLHITSIAARPRLLVELNNHDTDAAQIWQAGVDYYVSVKDHGEFPVPASCFEFLWNLGMGLRRRQKASSQLCLPFVEAE